MTYKITATIENWYPIQTSNTGMVIRGECYGDASKRFSDGSPIETSGVKNRSLFEGDVVQTRNNIYRLGKKLN